MIVWLFALLRITILRCLYYVPKKFYIRAIFDRITFWSITMQLDLSIYLENLFFCRIFIFLKKLLCLNNTWCTFRRSCNREIHWDFVAWDFRFLSWIFIFDFFNQDSTTVFVDFCFYHFWLNVVKSLFRIWTFSIRDRNFSRGRNRNFDRDGSGNKSLNIVMIIRKVKKQLKELKNLISKILIRKSRFYILQRLRRQHSAKPFKLLIPKLFFSLKILYKIHFFL